MQEGTNEKKPQGKLRQTMAFVWRWVVALVLLALVMINLLTYVFQIVSYNGTGMEPNLRGGQTLVILKTQEVKQGDIIAFYYNNQVLVRRVICDGGKNVEIGQDGNVSVGGNALDEPYLESKSIGQCNLTFPYYVQSGNFFVMGDNRTSAMDSRLEEIGTVPADRIIGKVILAF